MGGCWMFHNGCLHHILLNHISQVLGSNNDVFLFNRFGTTICVIM
ncbi:hypothetical protein M8C21_031162 [Ambrosia artemisiifolia]|uniref:Uncharacterized protein n=1 Tax=Ambrosia artemisiifolia TaxID=4212 RepID=A0AAD5GH67_AMBAR|nr:hypothetical protein M8C21_031162 [Ambrosia artemisiifolia]